VLGSRWNGIRGSNLFWQRISKRTFKGTRNVGNEEVMTKTHLIKTGTREVIRTFETRKSAERFAKLYNDLCGQQAAFSTKAAK
jgi:hypothetical protein